ncbi:MAG TPA: ABC transporter ATP-binding protein [Hypericibacter adhaerens]|uniref:Sugar ABC transporter ATP-binding protein n=1 Tax=Hypericibacter adhaerens TaxID=2602016 RepID=A0A5J6N2P9_9PROT|nr:ABC transporter ATP-binding protein [Hypericibacter adhaerens]QEX24232.1 sugar ABC transporter ATP-binding protein [Hypericibacter adhaerens]HWA42834.1 ABC transporter ATP-binding protein [Hypericibacter adhaerens]
MTAKLELRDLEKRFDETVAVKKLSLSLEKGEFVSLLGPSGCGKSTTLAMVAGFETPTAGSILVDGQSVEGLPPQRRRIGLVFQDYAVFSKLSVRANLAFGLEAKGVGRAERAKAVQAIAERLDLTNLLDRRGDRLNMSEMQRVAIGRVLVTEPQLVLLDEPMSNLDAALRASLRGEMKLIQKQLQQTVLYVTHDQVEAMSMSDRIAVMSMGELQQIGTPEEIYRRPRNRFVAEFIGDPPINLIACEVQTGGGQVAVTTAGHRGLVLGRGSAPAGRHWLGIRPHDIRIGTGGSFPVRFLETLGAEEVLHVEYGGQLLQIVTPTGQAREGDRVSLQFDLRRALLIDAGSDAVLPIESFGVAA